MAGQFQKSNPYKIKIKTNIKVTKKQRKTRLSYFLLTTKGSFSIEQNIPTISKTTNSCRSFKKTKRKTLVNKVNRYSEYAYS